MNQSSRAAGAGSLGGASSLGARDGSKARTWWVGLSLAIWLLATIGLRPLLLPDEGRYAGVTYEMFQAPGWYGALLPTLNGLPFFHKPPLLYWLDLSAMHLLGVNVFAVRCGPALLAWLMGMAVFSHAQRVHGFAVARVALAVLATSPFFYVAGQYINHDIGVAACITAAVLCAARAVEDPRQTPLRWLLAAYACCGLGVLAKGLIGIVLPAAIIGPWLLAQGRWRQTVSLLHPLGMLGFGVVVLPWMAAMQSHFAAFFSYFIVEQHFHRFTGTAFNNRMPVWFYAAVLPLLTLPWSLWLFGLRRRWIPAAQASGALYVWWTAVVVGFFSLPASKLVGYVLPALAPLALLLAHVLVARGTRCRRLALGAGCACVGLVGAMAWKAPGSHRELAQALRAQLQPGDRVAFVDEYFYDVPFYARLPVAVPVIVISDWAAPDLLQHDNWRKELAEAARFDPDRGERVLWPWRRLAELGCQPARMWIVAAAVHHARLAADIPNLRPVQSVGGVELLAAPAKVCDR